MKLESQVTSLELSKRLYNNHSINQKDAQFYWIEDHRHNPKVNGTYKARLVSRKEFSRILSSNVYSWAAFTVAELGEILPEYVSYSKLTCEGDTKPTWFVEADHIVNEERKDFKNRCFTEDTEVEARGLMLEYLVKNNLIV